MKKINSLALLFVIIMLLMFLGSMNYYFTIASLPLSFIISIIIAYNSFKKKNPEVCIGIILLLCLQNFCIGCGAHISGNIDGSLKLITQIPFMVICVIWFFLQLNIFKKGIKIDKTKKIFLLLLLSIVISIFINHGSVLAMLMNIRNLTVFYMAFEIAFYYLNTKDKFENFIHKYNKILLFMLIVGIVLLFGGYKLYSFIGSNEVYIAKGNTTTISGKLGGRFYTKLISKTVTRMGSLYYEPVNLAYLFSIGLFVNIFYKSNSSIINKNKWKNIIISGLGLLLTFGKGGWLIIISAIIFVVLKTFLSIVFKRFNYKTIFYITASTMVFMVFIFCYFYYIKIGALSLPHFWGIIHTFNSVKKRPYGYGLGTGGNMSAGFNGTLSEVDLTSNGTYLSTGGESAIMGFMYQIGVQGVLCLALCMFSMVNASKKRDKLFEQMMEIMPLIVLGAGILQANTFTPQCIVPFMFIQGSYKSITNKKGVEK